MAQLVPCPQCQRHVRVASDVCPFCAGSLANVAAGRPGQVPGLPLAGVKRATLFALSATVAAACTDNAQPLYGAPVYSGDAPTVDASLPVPMTGDPDSDSTALGSATASSGETSATEDLAMPEYGAPVPPLTSGEVDSTSGDAGVGDGGTRDGGAPDADLDFTVPPEEPEPAPGSIPVYGAPPAQER